MKKIYSFLFAATALFAASSCQKEIAPEVEAPEFEKITFTASTEVDTKTALHENGKSTTWVADDQISVFDANKAGNNRCFEIDEITPEGKTATFSYEGEFVKDNTQEDPTVVALYPYQANADCDFFYYDRNYITGLNFPAEQTAVAGGFDSKAAFALGLGTMNTMELGFQNLYALLKFTVRDADVKKVTVKVNEGAYIAGDAKIQMVLNTEKIGGSEPVFESPVLSIVENGTNVITLTCEEGFNTEATYYVAVAPTTYTSISVALDGTVVKQTELNEAKNLEANKIYNLKDLALPKSERGLAFENTEYTVTIGDEFAAPQLKGMYEDAKLVYEIVDSSADATIDSTSGKLTINSTGTVTVKVSAPESKYYKEDSATYTLTVNSRTVKLYVTSEKTGFAMNIYAWEADGTPITASYPGTAMEWDTNKSKYYYEFTLTTNEKTINYLVNVNGDNCKTQNQTATFSKEDLTYNLNWKWLYLKPSSNWKQSSAKFAAYFFTNNASGEYWQWMMKLDTNHYGCVIPGDYKNVIFCRMNSSATNMNWDNKWNQTGDLTIPTNGNNLFTVPTNTWDGATTTWGKKTF